jgi:hypothetical protein
LRKKKRIDLLEKRIDFLFKVLLENEAFKTSLDSGKWYKEKESK